MQSAYQEIEPLILQLGDLAPQSEQVTKLVDQITTLARAYMLPTTGDSFGAEMHLTRNHRRVMNVLMVRKGQIVDHDALLSALYFDRPDCDWADKKIVDVIVCRLRKELRRANSPFEIETIHCIGFRMRERISA